MKNIFAFLTLLLILFACNKEEAIDPSAEFSTSIQNNTLQVGEGFTLFLENTQGDFLVYYKGATEETTYSPTDETRIGTPVSNDVESLEMSGYNNPGQYQFTVIASSTGNWGEDYLEDVKSITINVEE